MIWDMHCHLNGFEGKTPDERIADAMKFADRMQIQRLVFSMGMRFLKDPTPDQLKMQNDELLQALSHWHDRAYGLVYVSPKYPEESLKEIERCIEKGPMIGVKLWVAQKCEDKKIDVIIKRCAKLSAIIFQHTWYKTTGNFEGESTPENLSKLAARHPNTPIICGHTGGNWEKGIRAVRSAKNVTIGIAGTDPTTGFVEMAVRELGPKRIVYGSDAGGRSFASQLAKVQGADIPDAHKKLILGENFKKMMLPILKLKGIRL